MKLFPIIIVSTLVLLIYLCYASEQACTAKGGSMQPTGRSTDVITGDTIVTLVETHCVIKE